MKEKKSNDIKDKKKILKDEEGRPKEIGGFENKVEPTRYGDWEANGRCSDF